MKKTGKILLTIGGIGLGALGIIKFIKDWKKGMEELDEQEEEEVENLKQAGVNVNKLRKEAKYDEADFTKLLFIAARFDSNLDVDMFAIESDPDNNIVGVEDCLDENVIHICQKIIGTKHGGSRRYLDFIIDIPERAILGGSSYRNLNLGNYLSTFAATAKKMSNEIVRFSEPARHKMYGFVVISRKNKDGEDVIEYRQLKDVVYKEFADDKHDGLSKFVQLQKEKLNKIGYSEYTKESKWLFINCPDLSEEDETILIENVILQYIISFPIRSNRPGELYGIDVTTGVKCIEYLTEEMVVEREGCHEKVTYRHLMFNAPNSDGYSDLSCYYTVNEDDEVIQETFVGFD